MTVADIITRTRVLLGDQEDQEFTDEEIMLEVNAALLELNEMIGFYIREESLPVVEDKITYEMPSDTMRLIRLKRDGAAGPELHMQAEEDLIKAGPVAAVLDQSANSFSLTSALNSENIDAIGSGQSGALAYPFWGK